MAALIKSAVQLLADAAWFAILRFKPIQSVQAENLFLRRQLALFNECDVQPWRIDAANRHVQKGLAYKICHAGCAGLRCSKIP